MLRSDQRTSRRQSWAEFKQAAVSAQAKACAEEYAGFNRWMEARHAAKSEKATATGGRG